MLAGIARCAPGANAVTKRLILASRSLAREDLLDQSADAFAACLRGAEGREGVTAFLEKRRPKWVSQSGSAGEAVVAIWNGIAPEGRTEFYEWHNREHMPEASAFRASGAGGATSPNMARRNTSRSTRPTAPKCWSGRTI